MAQEPEEVRVWKNEKEEEEDNEREMKTMKTMKMKFDSYMISILNNKQFHFTKIMMKLIELVIWP